jgi:hypothetical protein
MIYDTFTENDNLHKLTAYQELLQLIDLAEKVSDKIKRLQNANRLSMYGTFFLFLLSTIRFTQIFLANHQIFDLSVVQYAFFVFLITFPTLWLWSNNTKQVTSERATLRKLFNMIATQKQLAQNEMSILTKETIELRLNRIDFSVAK